MGCFFVTISLDITFEFLSYRFQLIPFEKMKVLYLLIFIKRFQKGLSKLCLPPPLPLKVQIFNKRLNKGILKATIVIYELIPMGIGLIMSHLFFIVYNWIAFQFLS